MIQILTLFLSLLASPALAQNVTCATRPLGDSSNACANTKFVGSYFINLLATVNTWTAYQKTTAGLSAGDGFAASQVGGWVNNLWPGSQYWQISPLFVSSVPAGGGAGTFAARMSDTVGGGFGSIQPLRCLAYVDANPSVYPSWCQYIEAYLAPGTSGYHLNSESSIASYWTYSGVDPYTTNSVKRTVAQRYSAGRGIAGVTNVSAAIDIVPNPVKFGVGINIGDGALDTSGGVGLALTMPQNVGFGWYNAAGSTAWRMTYNGTTANGGLLALQDGSIAVYGYGAGASTAYLYGGNSGGGVWAVGPSTGNEIVLYGNTTGAVAVQAQGAETNININLTPKGTGIVSAPAYAASGSTPTITGSGACTLGTQVGGKGAGRFTATAACAIGQTYTISGMPAAINGYVCDAGDRTTSGVVFQQTSDSTTSAVLTVRTTDVSNADVIQFKCMGY